MLLYKCDSCKKVIQDKSAGGSVRISSGKLGLLADLVLCGKCGSDIIKMLEQKKLLYQKKVI